MIEPDGTLWEGHLQNFAGNTVDTSWISLDLDKPFFFFKLLLLFIFVHFLFG